MFSLGQDRISRRKFLKRVAVSAGVQGLTLSRLSQGKSLQKESRATGTLNLLFVDGARDQPTSVRVEVLDRQPSGSSAVTAPPAVGSQSSVPFVLPSVYNGKAYFAEDAFSIEQPVSLLAKKLFNPYTRTDQFYADGHCTLSLPPGAYKLRVFKGIEYRVQAREVTIRAGETLKLTVQMSRWANLPEQGWYSADDHLHIPRPVKELDPAICKWMQAEDIHVANLLQWGHAKDFKQALQYQHGPAGIYQEGDYIVAAGQENPRTNILGHAIILGASFAINFPEQYLVYQLFWKEAERQRALKGYAHYGLYGGAQYGLSMDLPSGLLNFLEVVQADEGVYNIWYDILNLGIRMTPTAGTDYYPFATLMLPGRERFYTKVEGPFTYQTWLEGVRLGRTFASNGPILEFAVNGKEMGEEVILKRPDSVVVEGAVRFDPDRDNVRRFEVIENGQLIRSFPRRGHSPEIRFRFQHGVERSSWLAVRASGNKSGEAQMNQPLDAPSTNFVWSSKATWGESFYPASVCHSAPVYVTLENSPPLSAQPRAKALARAWLARLEELEQRLAVEQIQYVPEPPPGFNDGVDAGDLQKNRPTILEIIRGAKKYFEGLAH